MTPPKRGRRLSQRPALKSYLARQTRRPIAWVPPEDVLTHLRQHASLGLWVYEPLSKQLWWDERLVSLLKLPAQPATWVGLEQALHPADRGLLIRLQASLEAGASQHQEWLELNQAETRWLEFTACQDAAGFVMGSFEDVTVRHQLIERLRHQRQLYDLAISSSRAGIWDWPDLSQDALWLSPQIYQLLGSEAGELTVRASDWATLIHPEDRPVLASIMPPQADPDVPWRIQFRMRTQEGRYKWVESFGQILVQNQITRMLGTLLDIDERKQEQLQLQKQHAFQAILSELSYQLELSVAGLLGQSLDVLQRYLELPAGSIARVRGDIVEIQAIADTRPPGYKPLFTPGQQTPLEGSLVQPLLRSDRAQTLDELAVHNPARLQVLEQYGIRALIGVPYRIQNQRLGIIFCFGDQPRPDMSPQERDFLLNFSRWLSFMLERATQLEHLQKVNENKDRLLATVAHDLRDPLNVVLSSAKLLNRARSNPTQTETKLFKMISRACGNADHLIGELLEVGQLEREELLPVESTVWATLMLETLEAFEHRAQAKQIQLGWQCDAEMAQVALNPAKIRRVQENLLNNALKFTPAGGRIQIELRQSNFEAWLEISDTGIGIPPELQAVLFDKFSKAGREGLQGERSTGLGMYIVHEIARLHRGRIEVFSDVGQGTRFRLTLPILRQV
jgi:PAS domain S-box-containing protein